MKVIAFNGSFRTRLNMATLLLVCLATIFFAVNSARAGHEQISERERERETFHQGWEAAKRGDLVGLVLAIGSLPDYPLVPYLEFELLRQRADQVPAGVMENFLNRYRDWSFAGALETTWLRSLGRQGEYDTLLRHGRDSSSTQVRCHLIRARIEGEDYAGLEEEIEALWLSGRSRPEACDPVFDWWRRRGNPDPDVAWQRFGLAVDAGNVSLARYLRRHLGEDQRQWAERWLSMQTRPHDTLGRAAQWDDNQHARQLVGRGLRQLARSDWQGAGEKWQKLKSGFNWSAAERSAIERELALFRAVALDDGAIAAIDDLPDSVRDQQMLQWRTRAAMAHGDWPEVLASIRDMDAGEQARSRWRYWSGRALAAIDPPQAQTVLEALSAEPNYYGFLASAQLGRDFSLCNQELTPDTGVQDRLVRDAEWERAMELFQVGLHNHARRTWARMSGRLNPLELEQAALLMADQGWYDRAIAVLNNSNHRRAYPWRFPMAEKGRVLAEAEYRKVNPALVYGLMRAESSMQPDARSPAGARGLLQLMPGTAREVARRNGLGYNGTADLMDPATNIALGIAHLAELEEHFDGNWIYVAAAYNAGISAVTRWIEQRPQTDPDVWLETLPYYETRDYVPRILAFATIYEWKLGEQPGVLAANTLGGISGSRRFACPE